MDNNFLRFNWQGFANQKQPNSEDEKSNNNNSEETKEHNSNLDMETPTEKLRSEPAENSKIVDNSNFSFNPLFDYYTSSCNRKRKTYNHSFRSNETTLDDKYSASRKLSKDKRISQHASILREISSPQNINSTDQNNNVKDYGDGLVRKVKKVKDFKRKGYVEEGTDANEIEYTSSPGEDLPVMSLSALIRKANGGGKVEKKENLSCKFPNSKKNDDSISKTISNDKNVEETLDDQEKAQAKPNTPCVIKFGESSKTFGEKKLEENVRFESDDSKLRLEKLEKKFNVIDNFLKSQHITNKELLKHRDVSESRINSLEIYIKKVKQYLISKKIQKVKKEMSSQDYRRSLASTSWEVDSSSQKSSIPDNGGGEIARFASCREPGASGFDEEDEDDELFNGDGDMFGEFILKHKETSSRVSKKERLPLLLSQVGSSIKKFLSDNKKQSNLSYSQTLEMLIKKYGTNSNLSREFIKKLRNIGSVCDDDHMVLRSLLAVLIDMKQVYQIAGLLKSDSLEVFIEHIVQNYLTERQQRYWRIRTIKLKAKSKDPNIIELIRFIERKVAEDSLNDEETELMIGEPSEISDSVFD